MTIFCSDCERGRPVGRAKAPSNQPNHPPQTPGFALAAESRCRLLLTALWLLATFPIQGATLPFLPTHFSVFHAVSAYSTVNDPTPNRVFNFILPDSHLQRSGPSPLPLVSPYALNTNFPGIVEGVAPFSLATDAYGVANMGKTALTNTCTIDQETYTNTSGAALVFSVTAEMLVQVSGTLGEELQNRILPVLMSQDVPINYTFEQTTLPMNILGGGFDGTQVRLPTVMAYGAARDPNDDPKSEERWTANLLLAVNWGIDPLGNREYLLLLVSYYASASVKSVVLQNGQFCLPLSEACDYYYGRNSVGDFFNSEWQSFLAETGQPSIMNLAGAIPELLFLYDFSGQHSVLPARTVAPGQLDPSVVLPISFNPSNPMGYTPDTTIYRYFNQYDAGVAFSLPKRFHAPNPVPPPSGYTPGGNACGPTALAMFLYEQGLDAAAADLRTVYEDTTVLGLSATAADNNPFNFPQAEYWLGGWHRYPNKVRTVTYEEPDPLPKGTRIGYLYRQNASSASAADLTRAWNYIDARLAEQQPVEIRTDLGLGTGPGGGHCILLLGLGHQDALGKLYGLSGDYYIVADPAGHWFANTKGMHYGLVNDLLMSQDAGISYGGWFAMYPKELLRRHIWDKSNKIFRVTALTIGQPFHWPGTHVTVHSPVTLLITDPLGRQSGVTPAGAVLENIPGSAYEPPVADEEESGSSWVDPTGPKTVDLEDPLDGVYHIELTATNSGEYTLDWVSTRADGSVGDSQEFTNTVNAGDHFTYTLVVTNGGPPRLDFLRTGSSLAIFWPTNSPGYVLQTTTALSSSNGWVNTIGSLTVTNGEFVLTNDVIDPQRFYRLKH